MSGSQREGRREGGSDRECRRDRRKYRGDVGRRKWPLVLLCRQMIAVGRIRCVSLYCVG